MKFFSRWSVLFIFFLGHTALLRAEMPALLSQALDKERAQAGRWAYTETQETRNRKGKLKEAVVIRYDPSKPYAEQYSALSVDGQPPPKKVQKQCRERGEQEAAVREMLQQKSDNAADEEAPKIDLGSEQGVLALKEASVVEETDQLVTYKIPVVGNKKSSFPFEKIQVLIRVNKQAAALDEIRLSILSPFRMKLVAKIRGVEICARYTTVDPAHPPQVAAVNVDAKVSVFFANMDEHLQVGRSDYKRVKPFDERFSTKSGPLRTLGF